MPPAYPFAGTCQAKIRPDVNVKVRLFARYRELAGTGLLDLDIPTSSTALDAFDRVAERFPEMRPMRASTLMAVDAEFIRPETELRDGEELALMPPVSGGALGSSPTAAGEAG